MADDDEWGEWARPVPLLTAPMRISWDSCEISPRTTRSRSGLWDGAPVRYRSTPESSSWDYARIAAWAKPRGTTGWPFAALVYMSFCYTKRHNRAGSHSGVPRWRWNWVIYNPELIEPTTASAPSEYWAQCCSETITALVDGLGRPRPGRIAGDPTRDRWAG